MKRALTYLVCLLFIAGSTARAAESDAVAQVKKDMPAIASFEYGQDSGPLNRVETIVFASVKNPEQRAAVEKALIETLQADATTQAGKHFICRQLRNIGTARCVPALEPLLTDPELSSYGRYALGRIEAPEAAAAIHRALNKTSGKLQAGMIYTLAGRKYGPALSDIADLADSDDPVVAEAAVEALGAYGGSEAVKALALARIQASGEMRTRIDAAMLRCANGELQAGRKPQAIRIYEMLYADGQPLHLRIGALKGLLRAQADGAIDRLTAAMRSDNPQLQGEAIAMAPLAAPGATQAILDVLPDLPAEAQPLLLLALGERRDPAALPVLARASESDEQAMRLAAIDAMVHFPQSEAIEILAKIAATSEGEDQRHARSALRRLEGDNADRAMLGMLDSADPQVRTELIRALAFRRAEGADDELMKVARNASDDAARLEAIQGLGTLAGPQQLKSMVALLVQPKAPGDRPAIEKAIGDLFQRMHDKEAKAGALLAALNDSRTPAEAKPFLLRLLADPATPAALKAVRAALPAEGAVDALAAWPTPEPAGDLLQIARGTYDADHKAKALRGYIRMAGQSDDPTAMYRRALELAQTDDDRRLVLEGLGNGAASVEALELVEARLDDEDLKNAAAEATVQIADRVRQNNVPRAREAIDRALATDPPGRVRRQAQDILADMDKYEGYILAWMGAGPYRQKGKDGGALFDVAFPPETGEGDVQWKRLTNGVGAWDINLRSAIGDTENCACYLRTYVWSPEAQKARLELGSDDGVKIWLNGKLVHGNNVSRAISPRQDMVDVELQEGWNELMAKIVNQSGPWAFAARLRTPDSKPVEGLKVEPKKPE